MDAYGLVAYRAARLIAAIKGRAKKVLALDLDNTLWGGVIGDDGLEGIRLGAGPEGEAFVAFQEYVRALKDRGIVLAVCSKNEEATAKEPFERHPDMRLRLDDIAVFKANWNNKADNLREIAQLLNLGLDSFVFVDDNPVERGLVRELLPEVAVPELPEDPADYVAALDREFAFETVTFTAEDEKRGDLYRDNARRAELQQSFTDVSQYLRSLDMEGVAQDVDAFTLPRAAQLINKSNQFHLTTTRYTEAELEAFRANPDYRVRVYSLRDRFGDNGLISSVILKRETDDTLAIDTWVMSCRVLSRTMEEFICRDIIDVADSFRCKRVCGLYRPTKKNALVAGLYERMKFARIGDEDGGTRWELDLEHDRPDYVTFVRKRDSSSE